MSDDDYGFIPPSAESDDGDYEEEWQDLSERDLLEGIFIELTQIRALLSERETGGSSESVVYDCKKCEASVKAGERERHAVEQHAAPEDMAEELFEEK